MAQFLVDSNEKRHYGLSLHSLFVMNEFGCCVYPEFLYGIRSQLFKILYYFRFLNLHTQC